MTQEDIKEEGVTTPEETKEVAPEGDATEANASPDAPTEEAAPSEGGVA